MPGVPSAVQEVMDREVALMAAKEGAEQATARMALRESYTRTSLAERISLHRLGFRKAALQDTTTNLQHWTNRGYTSRTMVSSLGWTAKAGAVGGGAVLAGYGLSLAAGSLNDLFHGHTSTIKDHILPAPGGTFVQGQDGSVYFVPNDPGKDPQGNPAPPYNPSPVPVSPGQSPQQQETDKAITTLTAPGTLLLLGALAIAYAYVRNQKKGGK